MTKWSKPSGVDTSWDKPDEITVTAETDYLLQENGDKLLQENGDALLIEYWSGFRKIIRDITTIWK